MNLPELSIKRPIFISSIVLASLVVGALCLKMLGVDLFPEVNLPVVSVTSIYPGAGPAEIETLISKPLEDEISSISGLKRLTSKNYEGVSVVIAEFRMGIDIQYAEQKVRDRVDLAKAKFPDEAKEPVIRRQDPSDQPIISLALKADLPEAQLFDLADKFLKPRVEQINGVGLVKIVGGREREIHVTLDREKLTRRELSAGKVASRLAAAGENIPSGKINEGQQETIFRSLGEFGSVKEIADTLLNMFGNDVPTRVSDVGSVEDTLEDEQTRAAIDGEKALFLQVYRQSGSNIIAVVDSVYQKLDDIRAELAAKPGNPSVTPLKDISVMIRDNVEDVYVSIVFGIILTAIVVFLFLANGKSTIVTLLTLPNSLIGAGILIYLAKFSINMSTLMALSLAVGLVIDDAIVVCESIFKQIEHHVPPADAARKGTAQVQLAVIATTLVIIAAFLPLGFIKGAVGEFFRPFALTMCFAMAISLGDALTIAPALSAYLGSCGGDESQKRGGPLNRWTGALLGSFNRFQTWLESVYLKVLHFTLHRPLPILAIGLIIFASTGALFQKVPMQFVPNTENPEFVINLEMEPGTNLDAMNRTVDEAERVIRGNPEVELVAATIGNDNNEPNKAELYVKLVPAKNRTITPGSMKDRVREQLLPLSYAKPKIKIADPTGALTQPFSMNLIGNDSAELEKYAARALEWMQKDQRLRDVDTSWRPGRPEFQFKLKPGMAERYGITPAAMGLELRAQVEGMTPAKFRENGEEYDVRVRLKEDQRNLRENYDDIYVPNINGKLVKLSDFAAATAKMGPATIDRQDRGRFIQLSADIAKGANMNNIISDITAFLKNDAKLPPSIRYVFVGETEYMLEMQESVILAVLIAIIFIYLILSSLYESFVTPVTILISLPLSLSGSFLGLLLMHEPINILTMMGLVMALGVAGKNAILLVDSANQRVQAGMSRVQALIEAGQSRLRPILMTSIALIAGTVPVAIGLTEGAKMRTGMGVAVIGGMVSSTLLSLVIVPAVFLFVDRIRVWSADVLVRALQFKAIESGDRPQ